MMNKISDLHLCFLTALVGVMLSACGEKSKVNDAQFNFLAEQGITVTQQLMLGDTLTLPDIYCGDPKQTDEINGKKLNRKQYESLVLPAGKAFGDEMGNWMLLGVRDMGSGITLGAYYIGSGSGYSVELITYDKQGHVLDAINGREQHLLWRIDLSDASNDTVFTLDGHFTFNANCVTLHRIMGRCVMDFDDDLKGAPIWQQAWDQQYSINGKGHFVLQGQQVVMEKGKVDQYAALDFKSWDMLVCSKHDPGVMDTWNQYSELINSTYDPDYKYNPFPWDVAQLYQMNPQRFLRWISAPQNRGNRLLPNFKLKKEERPALLKEIGNIDDPEARQWLTALVKSWDNSPLTRHL